MPLILYECLLSKPGKDLLESRDLGAQDTATDHYPVPGELLRRWNKEIRVEKSIVEQLSPTLILAFRRFRDKE
jgi:hypothetical protein